MNSFSFDEIKKDFKFFIKNEKKILILVFIAFILVLKSSDINFILTLDIPLLYQFKNANELIQSLSSSFLIGYIMYYLLEYRPKRKDRKKIMETYIKNKVNSILTTYHNLLIILATGNGNMKVPKIDEEFKNIETEVLHLNRKMKLTSYPVYSNNIDKNNYTVEQFIKDVGFKTNQNCNSILNYIIYLDIELVNILAEVESSSNSLINFAPSDMPDCKLSIHKEIFIENTKAHRKLKKYYSENISDLPRYLVD